MLGTFRKHQKGPGPPWECKWGLGLQHAASGLELGSRRAAGRWPLGWQIHAAGPNGCTRASWSLGLPIAIPVAQLRADTQRQAKPRGLAVRAQRCRQILLRHYNISVQR